MEPRQTLMRRLLPMASRGQQPGPPYPDILYSPVLGDAVSAATEFWGFPFCLPSALSLVAGAEETKGLESCLGVAFEAWELATVTPGVT